MIRIPLHEQHVTAHASGSLCFEVVASAGKVLEQRSDDEKVVEFVTERAGRRIRTVELLKLFPPDRIEYSWLEGPLPRVEEEIELKERGDETLIAYRGAFWVRGPRGWIAGRTRIKHSFEAEVLEHLNQAKEISEARAARTHIHRRSGRSGSTETVRIYDEKFGPTGLQRRRPRR
ncbi:MAG: hypothetical protein ACRDJ5_07265 [Actinomycetota bacterium]